MDIFVDLTAPYIDITSPTDGTIVKTSTIEITGVTSDSASAMCGLTVIVQGNPVVLKPDGTWSIIVNLNPGPNEIIAEASDGVGNKSEARIIIVYNLLTEKGFAPNSIKIDMASLNNSNNNGIFEPGETVLVNPAWTNIGKKAETVYGAAINWSGPLGAIYNIIDGNASYGKIKISETADCNSATGNCYSLNVSDPSERPSIHWDAEFTEELNEILDYPWTIHIGESYNDVPVTHAYYSEIENITHYGLNEGLIESSFYPDSDMPRKMAAAFLARLIAGRDSNIPVSRTIYGVGTYNCDENGSSFFEDLDPKDPLCKHIHYIYTPNINMEGNQDPLMFCPDDSINRAVLAILIRRILTNKEGDVPIEYNDPITSRSYSCDPLNPNLYFNDVSTEDIYCKHVHYLWATGLINGCSSSPPMFCPTINVTRASGSMLIDKAFFKNKYQASLSHFTETLDLNKWSPYIVVHNDGAFDNDQQIRLLELYNEYGPNYPHRLQGIRVTLWDNNCSGKNQAIHNWLSKLKSYAKDIDVVGIMLNECLIDDNNRIEYVEKVVTNFADVIKYFEVGNEPVCNPGLIGCVEPSQISVENYVEILEDVKDYIAQNHANVKLIPAAFVGELKHGYPRLKKFIDIASNLIKEIGYLNVHYYCKPNEITCLFAFKNQIDRVSSFSEIWITETGVNFTAFDHIYFINEMYPRFKSMFHASRIYWYVFANFSNSIETLKAMVLYNKSTSQLFTLSDLYIALATLAPGPLKVDIKANGTDGPILVKKGDTFIISWLSKRADSCLIEPPGWTGKRGSKETSIDSNTNFIITCLGQGTSAIDNVSVKIMTDDWWADIKADS